MYFVRKQAQLAFVFGCVLLVLLTLPVLGKTHLEFWGFSGLVQGEKEILEAFNASHPDIELAFVPVEEKGLREKIIMASAGGIPPAVTIVKDTDIPSLALEGVIRPLDDLMARDNIDPATWVKTVLDSNRINGQLYAINHTTDVRALEYNRTLFSQAGLDPSKPPVTWEEMFAFTRKLTKVNSDGVIEQIGFTPLNSQGSVFYYAVQNGAQFISADGHKALLKENALKDAVMFMKDLYDSIGGYEAVHSSPAMAGDEYMNQTLAMRVNGNWRLNTMAKDKRTLTLDWEYTQLPVPAERYRQEGRFAQSSQFVTWSGGWRYAIPASVEDVDAAWEVLKFLTSVEGHAANSKGEYRIASENGNPYVPRFTANIEADRLLAREYLPYLPEKFEKAQWFFIDQLSVTTTPPISPATTVLWSSLSKIGTSVLRDGVSPEQALETAQIAVQGALDDFYSDR